MAKKTTVAALALVSVKNNKIFVSTKGSEVAPGSKWKGWLIKWGDNEEIGGNAKPTENIEHDYPILEPEPGLTEDSYDIFYEIKDSKGGTSQAVVDNVIILRNPINPPIPGPNITLLIPQTGAVGSNVIISGTGFGTTQGGSTVTFDGTLATINSWSATSISVIVPSIGDGLTEIVVTVNGIPSAPVIYNVTSIPPPVETFDFYVSKSGNNAWNGLFPTQGAFPNGPKLTLTGAQGGIALLSAGKSLGVDTGIYDETITSCPSGTSWNNKVRIAAMEGATVWLHADGSSFNRDYCIRLADAIFGYIEFDGINCDGSDVVKTQGNYRAVIELAAANSSAYCHHIRVQNAELIAGQYGGKGAIDCGEHVDTGNLAGFCEFINLDIHGGGLTGTCGFECSSIGIYLKCRNNLVENCDIHDTSAMGIQMWNPTANDDPSNNIIKNNRIHDITRTGVLNQYLGIHLGESAQNNQIYNNLIYNIGVGGNGDGINTFSNPSNNKIWFNTIYNCSGRGIFIQTPASDNIIQNNIAYQNPSGNLVNQPGTGADHNSTSGVNPQFANPSAGDFHLTAATPSSIINAGVAIAEVPKDFDDITRGDPPDIGAYEKV